MMCGFTIIKRKFYERLVSGVDGRVVAGVAAEKVGVCV